MTVSLTVSLYNVCAQPKYFGSVTRTQLQTCLIYCGYSYWFICFGSWLLCSQMFYWLWLHAARSYLPHWSLLYHLPRGPALWCEESALPGRIVHGWLQGWWMFPKLIHDSPTDLPCHCQKWCLFKLLRFVSLISLYATIIDLSGVWTHDLLFSESWVLIGIAQWIGRISRDQKIRTAEL